MHLIHPLGALWKFPRVEGRLLYTKSAKFCKQDKQFFLKFGIEILREVHIICQKRIKIVGWKNDRKIQLKGRGGNFLTFIKLNLTLDLNIFGCF